MTNCKTLLKPVELWFSLVKKYYLFVAIKVLHIYLSAYIYNQLALAGALQHVAQLHM